MKYLAIFFISIAGLSACQSGDPVHVKPAKPDTPATAIELPKTPILQDPVPPTSPVEPVNPVVVEQKLPRAVFERTFEVIPEPVVNEPELEGIPFIYIAPEPIISVVANPLAQPERIEPRRLNPNQLTFSVSNLLGKGSFGEVYEGRYDGSQVAIKRFLPSQQLPEEAQRNYLRHFEDEIRLMANFTCPNIITLFGVTDYDGTSCMVMERASDGSLSDVLKSAREKKQTFSERHQLEWCQNLAAAVRYIHDRGILHRDIKSLNVLVVSNAAASSGKALKLTDFGEALDTRHSLDGAANHVGSIPWWAPELVARVPSYSQHSDMYAVGMVFWEILAKKTPQLGRNAREATRNILDAREDRRQPVPKAAPREIVRLVRLCWKSNPAARPHASDVEESLRTRIQVLSEEEAAQLQAAQLQAAQLQAAQLQAAQLQAAQQPAAIAVDPAPVPPAPSAVAIAPEQEQVVKPRAPTIGFVSQVAENAEKRLKGLMGWMFDDNRPTQSTEGQNDFKVVRTNWMGVEKNRLLRITQTHLERVSPIDGEVRDQIALEALNRLEVSRNNDTLRVVFENDKGQGESDTYQTTDAKQIARAIRAAALAHANRRIRIHLM